MKRDLRARSLSGITAIEVTFVVIVTALVIFLVLPSIARLTAKTSRSSCIINVKNIGLAYRIFATDNADFFPFQISTNRGGTSELSNSVVAQFSILSNEIPTPILVCQTRKIRQVPAKDWTSLKSSNVSYYLCLNANQAQTNSILAGDAGFSVDGAIATNGLIALTSRMNILYPNGPHGPRRRNSRICRWKRA